MIIIRGNETQSLPNQTGLPNKQYAGEGQALAQAGPAVASVANRGVALAAQLNDHYQRLEGVQAGKRFHSSLKDAANKYWQDWDQNVVKAGLDPTKAEENFESWFSDIRESEEFKSALSSDNPYFNESHQTAYTDVHEEVMGKARPYARSTYLSQSKERASINLDSGMNLALLADAQGDHEGYLIQAQKDLAYIDSLKGTLYTPDDTAKAKQVYAEGLETKRAYQTVTRDPQGFLEKYHNNEFGRLEPKTARELVSNADTALARKVDVADRNRRLEKEGLDAGRTQVKNDLLTMAETDPIGALNQALSIDNRRFLGPEFDNTVSTLRTLANPTSRKDDSATVRHFNHEIEFNPRMSLAKALDEQFRKGQLKQSTWEAFSHRLTERVEKFKDKAEQDRTRLIKEALDVYKPMLRVTGINNFDQTSNEAMQSLEEEALINLRQDPKLDPYAETQRLMLKYSSYIDDHVLGVTGTIIEKYGFKSEADAQKALIDKRISQTQFDKAHVYFKTMEKAKPASTQSSTLTKKKK